MARAIRERQCRLPKNPKPRSRPRESVVPSQPLRCEFGRSPGLGVSPANAGCSSARHLPNRFEHRSVAFVRALFPPHRRGAAPDLNRIPFFRHGHNILWPRTEATTVWSGYLMLSRCLVICRSLPQAKIRCQSVPLSGGIARMKTWTTAPTASMYKRKELTT